MTELTEGQVRLVPAETGICDGPYFEWMQDTEILRYLEARHADRSREGLRRFVDACLRDGNQHLYAIRSREDGRHIGNIKLSVDPLHGRGDIGIVVGDRQVRGRGLGTLAIRALSRFAFAELDLAKLTAGCYAPNVASQKAFERAGFVVEAVRPSHYVCDGERVDGLFLARLRDAE
jgi:ribosomal-protein-alanine N-acetyltransferase